MVRASKKAVWLCRSSMIVGLCLGSWYWTWNANASQSTQGDADLVVLGGAFFFLPTAIVIMLPAWLLCPAIVKARNAGQRYLRVCGAVLFPLAAVVAAIITQHNDWDELILFVLPFAPLLLTITILVFCLKDGLAETADA